MPASLPLLLVPGLTCTARLYAPQVTALWPSAPLMIADHRKDHHIDAVARRILDNAPPRFSLAGLSMGGYIALAMMRLAPERIARLALLDTSARADTPEQIAARQSQIAMTKAGRYGEIADLSMPRYVHLDRQNDAAITGAVRQMSAETGPEAFIRQLKAIMSRPDSRPMLRTIVRRSSWSAMRTWRRHRTCRRRSPAASPARHWSWCRIVRICRRSSSRRQ
jgi:pimeloyl-ACP methyl ester carboxylesterase